MGAVRVNPEYQAKGSYVPFSMRNDYVSNLNDMLEPGIYSVYPGNTANCPVNTSLPFGTVLVMTYGEDKYRVFQVYLACTDNSNAPKVYTRHSYVVNSGGHNTRTWSGWTTLH